MYSVYATTSDRQAIVQIKSQYLGFCHEGALRTTRGPCAICSSLDSQPVLSVCVLFCFVLLLDRGHVVHPTELRGAENHKSVFPYIYFLRRTHVGFVNPLASLGDRQVAASVAAACC